MNVRAGTILEAHRFPRGRAVVPSWAIAADRLTLAMFLLGSAPGLFGRISGFDLFVGIVAGILMILFAIQSWTVARRLAAVD